ncbi:hypothetical protein IQ07DRAFT_549395 [Pyrenochaeta sp. DS3sAY3a]|nr:hypothetical protein IQ07DRAFT_549395 [Pyrenochaeta sp. DS3sAY3a]
MFPPNYNEVEQRPASSVHILQHSRKVVDDKLHSSRPLRRHARSHTANWSPGVPVMLEVEALYYLKAELKEQSKHSLSALASKSKRHLIIVDVEDFEIYRCPHLSPEGKQRELISLHFNNIPKQKSLCLDGYLSFGGSKHYVQEIPIHSSSIWGLRDEASLDIHFQSSLVEQDMYYEVWYRLRKPTREYERFHEPFLWVAQLAKHVINYLKDSSTRRIGLGDFRTNFHRWLSTHFTNDKDFRHWHRLFRKQIDFRVAVNAYIGYIHYQASSLQNSQLFRHPLWAECMVAGLTCIKAQPQVVKDTLATSGVHNSFKHMYFGNNIRVAKLSDRVKASQEARKVALGFPRVNLNTSLHSRPKLKPYGNSPVRVGDVIAMDPDQGDLEVWREAHWEWLAYVQDVSHVNDAAQRLSVLWLYRPRETHIFKAEYPFEHELFLSDNCNCKEGTLLSTHVKGKYIVDWSPKELSPERFFIRQMYRTDDSAFVSLRPEHKTCMCRKKVLISYQAGDTVYMKRTVKGEETLEPCLVKNAGRERMTVRKLLRLGRDCPELVAKTSRTIIAPNELVLTDEYEDVSISRIERRCFIRLVQEDHLPDIQTPYNRGGAGDFWYMSMGLIGTGSQQELRYLTRLPEAFHQGPTAVRSDRKLKGLSIFSGGGSLDRGLEEGGAVEFQTVVDLSAPAMHTQRANARFPNEMRLYLGSVDDYFHALCSGADLDLVAKVGEVEFIAAGSPCPGFSALQKDHLSAQSLRNASHISTFCSFVDVYRPLYGVLENVVNMASTRTGLEDQNVLSQLVACLASMGYQVNQYIMDAWCYGSAQQRSRIILTIAAPGLTPIAQPPHTHRLPSGDTHARRIGMLPNGENFGNRLSYPTPFAHMTAGGVTADLPDIGDGSIQTCIPYPDHRLVRVSNGRDQALLQYIPRQPPGCGYKEAYYLGLIPKSLLRNKKEDGKAFQRIRKDGLIPTITTAISAQDSRNGACVHWNEHRTISILDARRTQGYRDDEPIIGSLSQQFEIVGNGVDRKVSFALGLALHRAVEQTPSKAFVQTCVEAGDEYLTDCSETEEQTWRYDCRDMATALPADLHPTRTHPSVLIQARPRPGLSSPIQPFSNSPNASFESTKRKYTKRASLSAISSMKGVATGKMKYKRSREDAMAAELENGDNDVPRKKRGRPRLSYNAIEDEDNDGPSKRAKTRGRPRLPKNHPVIEDSEPEEVYEGESTASRKVQIQVQVQSSRSAAQPIVPDSDSETMDFSDDYHLPQEINGTSHHGFTPVVLEDGSEAMDWCSDMASTSQISESGLRRSRSIADTIQTDDTMDIKDEIDMACQVTHVMPQVSSSKTAAVNGTTEFATRVPAQRNEPMFSTFRSALLGSSAMAAGSVDPSSGMVEQSARFSRVLVGDIS